MHCDDVSSTTRVHIALQVRSTLCIELEGINLPVTAHQRCNQRTLLGLPDVDQRATCRQRDFWSRAQTHTQLQASFRCTTCQMGGLVAWGRAAVHDMRARPWLQRVRRHAAGPALRGAAEAARR